MTTTAERTVKEGDAHDVRKFRNALGWFTTGVAVVTTRLEGGDPIGITVNSFSSVSLDPPMVLWCLDKQSDTLPVFEKATHFTVNVLREEHQEVSSRLAKKGDHSLADIEVKEGESRCPALVEALAHFECKIEARHDAGDHVIMVGRVLKFDYVEEGRPLLYHRGGYKNLPPVV
ncbi:MAG: flavin reductase family protein [Parvibaculum sp.]